MNCEHLESKLVPYLLKDLPEAEHEAVRRHLGECESCRASVRELEQTLDLLDGALAAPFEVPAGLDEIRRLKIFAAEPTAPPAKKPFLLHPFLLQVAAGVALLLLGAALLLPSMSRSRKSAMTISMDVEDNMDMARVEEETPSFSRPAPPPAEPEPDRTAGYEGGGFEKTSSGLTPSGAPLLPEPVMEQPVDLGGAVDNKMDETWKFADGSGFGTGKSKRPAAARSKSSRASEFSRHGGRVQNELKAVAEKQGLGDDLNGGSLDGLDLDTALAGTDSPPLGEEKDSFGWSAFDDDYRDGLAKSAGKKYKARNEKLNSDNGRGTGLGRNDYLSGERVSAKRQAEAHGGSGGGGSLPGKLGKGGGEGIPAETAAPGDASTWYANEGERTVAPMDESRLLPRPVTGPAAPAAKPQTPSPARMPTITHAKPARGDTKDIRNKERRRADHFEVYDREARVRRTPEKSLSDRHFAEASDMTPLESNTEITFGLATGAVDPAPLTTAEPQAPEDGLATVAGTIVNGNYTIQSGDTLSAIAKRKNISVDQLAKINQIADPNAIRAGQKLTLPSGETEKNDDTTIVAGGRFRQLEQGQKSSEAGARREEQEALKQATGNTTLALAEDMKRIVKESGEQAAEEILTEVEVSDDGVVPLLGDLPVSGRLFASRLAVDAIDEDEEGGDRGEISEPVFRAYSFNPYIETKDNAFSTFSIDVDTAAYTLARRYMVEGSLPPPDAVRTEEFLNFFNYNYPAPKFGTFAVYSEAAPTPLGSGYQLKVGIKGKRIGREEQRNANLTFVIDTSGSMDTKDRLGLARKSLKLLVDRLGPQDQVAIVQYSSQSRLVLEHTPASQRQKILEAIDALQVSGSTNLEQGLTMGYQVAARIFDPMAINRVLLVSDGAANLGAASAEEILGQVESYRKQGIFCSIFGFGIGTYNDVMLETLANKGNGSYQFIDSEEEARRVFVDDLSATLNTIASDVKIQVEFNPERVQQYRQLGYENRQLTKQQFRDDTVDAGEVGSGQSVTALYEVHLQGDPNLPVGTVRVRYRNQDTGEVEEISRPITAGDLVREFNRADIRFRLAAAVAAFAEKLRGTPYTDHLEYRDIAGVLRPVAMELELDPYVQELSRLVQAASSLPRAAE